MLLLRALASGSSGNAYVLRTDRVTLLFDAGLRIPKLERALQCEDMCIGAISAVLISHEHRDHCLAARELASDYSVPVLANEQALRAAHLDNLALAEVLPVGKPVRLGDVEVTTFLVSHDAARPVGFLVRHGGKTVVIATDLGVVTNNVCEMVRLADLVILESNHDPQMLHSGRYPVHLRRRIGGPRGHLSNAQAAAVLVRQLRDDHVDVWLAHLSHENNRPSLALEAARRTLQRAGMGTVRVAVALRDRPSLRWTGSQRARQLGLFETQGV
ncbi:MAG: MBL fold metallo-hydrolase [Chloroflexota bacterium]